jgi:hypothetical protein
LCTYAPITVGDTDAHGHRADAVRHRRIRETPSRGTRFVSKSTPVLTAFRRASTDRGRRS